jgi:hypothetical protein
MKKRRKIVLILVAVLFIAVFLFIGNNYFKGIDIESEMAEIRGQVTHVKIVKDDSINYTQLTLDSSAAEVIDAVFVLLSHASGKTRLDDDDVVGMIPTWLIYLKTADEKSYEFRIYPKVTEEDEVFMYLRVNRQELYYYRLPDWTESLLGTYFAGLVADTKIVEEKYMEAGREVRTITYEKALEPYKASEPSELKKPPKEESQ